MAPRKKKSSEYVFPHPMENESLVGHGDTLRTFMNAWENRDTHPIHPVWMLAFKLLPVPGLREKLIRGYYAVIFQDPHGSEIQWHITPCV